MSFERSAHLYDALYAARGKDYAAEADLVRRLLPQPTAAVLDVGCGTGEHLQQLATVATLCGLDADAAMLRMARAKLPEALLLRADMRRFSLRRRFDAVTCLFASIGYLADAAAACEALGCMAQHVTAGGLLLVEPPLSPDHLKPAQRSALSIAHDDSVVDRVATAAHEPGKLRVHFDYALRSASGVERFHEEHVILSLPLSFFRNALGGLGFAVTLERAWPSGPGLFIARAPA